MDLELKGALVGMLLGDAGISKRDNILTISHAIVNRDYVEWKGSILEGLTGVKYFEYEASGPNGNRHRYYRVWTKRHPKLDELRGRMYYSGRKTVDDHVLKMLTPKGLAIWYMDDGSIQVSNRAVRLATCGFNYAEHEMMSRYLAARFGLHTTIVKNGVYFNLRMREKSHLGFFGLISPFVDQVPSMRYKLGPYARPPEDSGVMTQSDLRSDAENAAETTASA